MVKLRHKSCPRQVGNFGVRDAGVDDTTEGDAFMVFIRWGLAGLLALVSTPSWTCEIEPRETARVKTVLDGRTMMLEERHRMVRLAGLSSLKGEMDEKAAARLSELVLGKTIGLAFDRDTRDRYDRIVAYVTGPDGRFVQDDLLRAGVARVETTLGTRACARRLLAAESRAREQGLGFWANSDFGVRTPENAGEGIGEYVIVEGRVVSAKKMWRSGVYLNFGEDWNTDFTVYIDDSGMRLFRRAVIDPLDFNEKVIRVRGWVADRKGPLIIVSHPEQLEWDLGL